MSASARQVLMHVLRQKHVTVGTAYACAEQPQLVLEMHKEHIAIPVIMFASARQVLLLVLHQKHVTVGTEFVNADRLLHVPG